MEHIVQNKSAFLELNSTLFIFIVWKITEMKLYGFGTQQGWIIDGRTLALIRKMQSIIELYSFGP